MVREPVALFQNSCVVAAAVATPHLHRKKKDEEEQETPFRNSWMAAAAEATSYLCRIKKHVEEQLEEEEEKEEEHHHHHHHYQQQQQQEEEEEEYLVAVILFCSSPRPCLLLPLRCCAPAHGGSSEALRRLQCRPPRPSCASYHHFSLFLPSNDPTRSHLPRSPALPQYWAVCSRRGCPLERAQAPCRNCSGDSGNQGHQTDRAPEFA